MTGPLRVADARVRAVFGGPGLAVLAATVVVAIGVPWVFALLDPLPILAPAVSVGAPLIIGAIVFGRRRRRRRP